MFKLVNCNTQGRARQLYRLDLDGQPLYWLEKPQMGIFWNVYKGNTHRDNLLAHSRHLTVARRYARLFHQGRQDEIPDSCRDYWF